MYLSVLPHMLPVEFGSDIIFLNDMVTSSCTVNKGDFPIDIFWKFNERRIASEDGITVSRTNQRMSVLTIDAVRDQHSGNYTCVAQNRAGQVQQMTLLQVNVGPSVFPFDFGEEPVDMMNTVSIQCVVSKGDTPIMIEWLFNGNRVATDDGINIMKSGQKISILSIESVQSRHAGNYTCVARNKAGESQHTSELKVIAVPQIMPFEFGEEPFDSSSTVSVQCVITKGDVPIDIGWMFNGRRISSNDGITVSKLGQKMSTLYIESIRSRHAGNYTCRASNAAGSVEHSSELKVIVVPIILPFEFGEEAFDSGSTASVSCIVTKGDTPIDISWMFNGRRISIDDGILITKGGGKISMLSIESVHSSHAGNYTCSARNTAGSVQHTAELQVMVIPLILPFEFGEEAFDTGSTASVSCIITKGDVPIDIGWSFNGRRLAANDAIMITNGGPRVSILSIDAVDSRHAGNYTCHASNRAGSTKQTAELQVMVVPIIFPFEFGDEAYDTGSTVSVSCIVTKGDAPIDISWLFNGRRLSSNDGVTITRSGNKISILSIESVLSKQSGNYTCSAQNQAGIAEHTSQLRVIALPIILPFEFGDEPFDTGSTASVSCIVTKGDTPIDISWLYNGRRIATNDGILIMRSGHKASMLTIESVQSRHAGNYTCHAANRAGEVMHTSLLQVMVLPVILPFEFGEEALDEASMATVQCAVTKGDTPISFSWLFNEQDVVLGETGILVSKSGQRISMLTIESVQSMHAGNYTCVAKNVAGQANHTSELKVIELFHHLIPSCTLRYIPPVKPFIMPFEFGDEPFDMLTTSTVSCAVVKGDVPIEINWMFNGENLGFGDGITITKSGPKMSILYIDSVQPRHAGRYTCVARNKAGFVEHSSELKVIVLLPFEFGDEPADVLSTTMVSCAVAKGDTPLDIEWLFEGRKIEASSEISIMKSGQKISMLSIETVQPRHAGNYTCLATNRAGSVEHTSELKVIVPPILLPFDFGEEPADVQSTTTVSCAVAKGDPPIEINWMFNGSKIFTSDGILITKSGQKISFLSIESVQARHAGNYTCVARNRAGFAEHTSELKVIVPPIILPFDFGEEPADVQSTTSVNCAVAKGDPPIEINWMFNGSKIFTSDGILITKSGQKISFLSIESVQARHAGNYTCVARNRAGFAEHTSELKVIVPPILLPFEFGEEPSDMASTTIVSCAVAKGDTPIDINWMFNGSIIHSNDGVLISKSGQKISILSIESVQPRHAGNYTCIARNRAGLVEHTSELKVIVPPILLPFEFGEEPSDIHSTTTVSCAVAKGDTPIEINWMFNGSKIFSNDGITITKSNQKMSLLYIESVQARHAGNYTCVARNKAGFVEHTSELKVIVTPIIMPFEFGDEPFDIYSTTTVTCAVTKGDSPIELIWLFNDYRLRTSDGVLITSNGQKISFLSIESVQPRHAGNYTCIAKNRAGEAQHSSELKVMVIPIIMPFDFGEDPFDIYSTATVSCAVTKGDSPIEISWYFNSYRLHTNDGVLITPGGQRVSMLSIESVQPRHAGNYTCIAKNPAGIANHSAELMVMVLPIILPFEFGEESFDIYSATTVSCVVTKGDLPITIVWLFNDRQIHSGDGVLITNSGHRISMLSIESVQPRHAGNYSCVASNKAGTAEYDATLNVMVLPIIHPFEFGEEPFDIYSAVTISCTVTKGDLPINITWTFNKQPILSGDSILLTRSGQRSSLLSIESVHPWHAGNYTCAAHNPAGTVEHSSALVVIVVPYIMPFEFGDEPFDTSSMTTVSCAVTKGDMPIEILWSFNGQPLYTSGDSGVIITKSGHRVSMLTIESVGSQHAGNYTCLARNKAGEVRHISQLKVLVPPSITPFFFGEEPLNAGESTAVNCMVFKGDAPLEIRWYMNGNQLPTNENGVIIGRVSERLSSLSIDPIGYFNRGTYECRVKNRAGEAFHSAELVINVVPTIMHFSFGEEILNTGDSVAVNCMVVKGDSPIEIRWYLNNVPISSENEGIVVVKLSEKLSSLSINSIEPQHRGFYECRVKNKAGEATSNAELIINALPVINPFHFEEHVDSEESVQVTCHASKGDLPIEIGWLFNEKPIRISSNIEITSIGKRSSSLNIPSVGADHSGVYTCVAKNIAGIRNQSAELFVNVLPRIFPFSFGEDPSYIDSFVTVQCAVTIGDLPIDIEWLHGGSLISKSNDYGMSIVHSGRRVSTLTIESIRDHHAGNYTCRAQNQAGTVEQSAELIINVPPKIVPFSFGEETMNSGDSGSVQCNVLSGDFPLSIRWYFNGYLIDDHTITITSIGKRLSVLNIDSVHGRHAGNYTCEAQNKADAVSFTAELHVNVPPRWILEPTDKAFAQGSNAKVECKADGFPKPQVTWKKAVGDTPGEYKDLRSNDSSIRVEEGSLFIQNIQKSNEGYYLCEAINGIGSGLSAVTLITVQAPPEFVEKLRNQTARRGEPTVLQCEAKGEKPIGILWNMNNIRLDPKSDNRYTIREEILPNGVTSSLSIKRTERSDSALFTCMATNAFGSDDTSINMIIQEPPEMPYALKVLDKSGRTVQLSWAKPYDGNSVLKRYIIEFKRSRGSWENDIDRVIVPGDTNEAQVQKLSPATTYNIRIVAENDIGVSDPSDVVTIITAEEAPSGKPQTIKVEAINQSTLRVSWKAPPRAEWNGDILGYYVGYKQTSANALYVYETVNYSPEGGEGKEHSLEINNLKTYTQYSIVIQTFNKVGAGPMSDEEKQYTAEGTPDQPPSDTMCTTLTSQTIRVSWVSPPLESANGVIKGYKVVYAPSDLWNNDKNKDYKKTASSDTVLHGLKKYTNYTMQVLATTSGGDGVRSAPIHCQTEQDVPEAPTAVKALVMSEGSILVSWQPPAQPNGLILQYTVYIKSGEQEPKSHKVPSFQMSYEASGLEKNQKYEFWVTASTTIGEGQSSKTLSAMPSDKVPAKIASFDDKFTATFKEDAKLPCMAVGSPTPDITWKIKGVEFVPNERIRQLPEGSLFIKDVIRQDAGDYTCTAENSIAKDSITHRLIVLAPPQSPQLTLTATTTDSLSVKLKPHESDTAPLQGYTLHYKPEFGEWETIDVALEAPKYTIEKLYCGSRYQVYATAYNTIGAGEPSDILNTRTKGSKPLLPEKSRFIEVSSNSITLHLPAWKDGGCRMSHFVVEHKKKDQIDWNQISNNVKPGGNFVVLDLEPATWYNLRVTAHNNAGFTVAEYEFATLTITGGTIAPTRDIPELTAEDTIRIILSNLNLVVPVVAALLVIIIAIIVICILRSKGNTNKGTVAPSFGSVQPGSIYPPWIPHWIDLNVMVPLIATVIVVAVGVLVICVAISRRRDDDPRCGPKDVYYDVVYNQSMGPAGAATLDKRRPDIRDELGYIAPPNRKLPPVPGSNYNTCDRVKRGTVISMEDEICPYATFHLLGFREEMDPTKAMNFQTFPHQNGMGGPGHMGTMGSSMAMQVPSHNRYARKNSQGGQSSIYTPAPEYDDPANCAEEDQYRRYTRINSQGGSLYCGPGPEYDDPANCAPEDDQYGSQYGGNYGTPYEHYGSRGSVGRRSVGSPEPPPPPPRNHDTSNSSFNDSKESNEISEAECDRDNGPRGNYGEPSEASSKSNDAINGDETEKLLKRNEVKPKYTKQTAATGNTGLTAYDTMAV
uniref:Down syndrome cell adhesion molecule n=1 Tax=Anopheles dirus TaxID=7168 RepID=A0A182NC81_9DIPT